MRNLFGNLFGNLFERWTENEMRITVVCALLSAVSLALSLTGTFSGVLPADIAWVAIVLCGFPILLGAADLLRISEDPRPWGDRFCTADTRPEIFLVVFC